jgi:hypothetical protein
MMERINWDHFPEPFSQELPFYVEKAYERLSPEGVELLDEVLDLNAPATHGKKRTKAVDEAYFEERFSVLPEWDFTAIVAIIRRLRDAFGAALDQAVGERDLLKQGYSVFARAQELDPEFAARGDAVTMEEAIAVLEAHGVRPGISDEVLEMTVEVRPDGGEG